MSGVVVHGRLDLDTREASSIVRHGKKGTSTENTKCQVASSGMLREAYGSNSGQNCVKVELSFCRCVWPRQVHAFHEIQEFSNGRSAWGLYLVMKTIRLGTVPRRSKAEEPDPSGGQIPDLKKAVGAVPLCLLVAAS